MGVRLPSEYQEVEYIESDGMQSIQTDVLPSNSIGFDCTFLTKSDVSAVNYGCIFGSRISSGIRDFQLTTWVGSAGGSLRFGPARTCSAGITKGNLMSASLRNRVFTNASGTIVTLPEYNWQDDAVPIALFLLRSVTNYTQGGSGCRIYVMRFYDGDNLIRDYVPCYRKSDNVIGMYELVTGAFLTNATVGAESFTKGPDVIDSISPWLMARRRALMMWKKTRLPSEYQEVEYLETSQTGAPYIDSGVAITEDLVFEIDFQLTNSGKATYFMGTYNGYVFYLYLSGDSTPYFQTAFGSAWANTTLLADTQRHKFVYQFENEKLVVRDSNTTILTKPKAGFPVRSILVAGTLETQNKTPCRTYESKMTKSGVVIQDLIPCYRKADDTPGMYDLVSNTFFTNAGTGEFIVGADIN